MHAVKISDHNPLLRNPGYRCGGGNFPPGYCDEGTRPPPPPQPPPDIITFIGGFWEKKRHLKSRWREEEGEKYVRDRDGPTRALELGGIWDFHLPARAHIHLGRIVGLF